MVNPLRKCKLTGELYRRLPEIESKLSELLQLPEETLVERSLINDKTSVQLFQLSVLYISLEMWVVEPRKRVMKDYTRY